MNCSKSRVESLGMYRRQLQAMEAEIKKGIESGQITLSSATTDIPAAIKRLARAALRERYKKKAPG